MQVADKSVLWSPAAAAAFCMQSIEQISRDEHPLTSKSPRCGWQPWLIKRHGTRLEQNCRSAASTQNLAGLTTNGSFPHFQSVDKYFLYGSGLKLFPPTLCFFVNYSFSICLLYSPHFVIPVILAWSLKLVSVLALLPVKMPLSLTTRGWVRTETARTHFWLWEKITKIEKALWVTSLSLMPQQQHCTSTVCQ